MTTFDKREEGFEKKFAHDEELKFKAVARRNKLLGLWAAGQLGKSGTDLESYAREVHSADFEVPGDSDVVAKLRRDLTAAGFHTEAAAIREHLAGFQKQAWRENVATD